MPQKKTVPRWIGAVSGIGAAAAGLAVAEAVAVLTGAASAPLVAVGGVVIDHVPAPVTHFAIAAFGTRDKAALLGGMTVLLAAVGALLGALALRRRRTAYASVALVGVVGMAAALTRAGAAPTAVLPSLLGATASGIVLDILLPAPPSTVPETGGTSGRQGDQTPPVEATLQRRRFLARSGGTLAAAVAVGLVSRQLLDRRNVAAPRAQVRLPSPASPEPPAPAGADLGVPGLSSFVTPNPSFYRIDTALSLPQVDPRTWRLRIHGRVRNPVTITYDQLLAMPTVERYITLTCVSNEVGGDLIGNARWLGVPVKPLLERAGPLPGADQVVGRSVDGFTVGTPTEVLVDGRDALLAIGMNGQPLPIEHGFPVRMVVPGLYGYVSATKWITELELTSFADYSAYWISQGWAARAPVKTESRIDTPRDGSSPRAGAVTVAGVAWTQRRGIAKVEVRVDGGKWQVATLGQVPSVDTWRQWSWAWHASPGTHRIEVRATDNDGQTQTAAVAPPEPDGATGWHSIEVSVR